MTDRSELVKLADELEVDTINLYLRELHIDDLNNLLRHFQKSTSLRHKAAAALRRLASSDGGVKGEPEPVAWPANLNPRTLDLVQRFALALAKKLRLAEEKYDHTDGWLRDDWESECRDHLYQHLEKGDPRDVAAYCAFMWHHDWITCRPVITAPPADAGMREAFVRVLASLAATISILERTPKAKKAVASDKMFDTMLDDYRKALEAGRAALTAPGATTKSDGGSRTAPESCPNCFNEDDCANVDICNAVNDVCRPSDPSSTRSDVTASVAELARFINGYTGNDENGNRCARALLDQFQIRRKK